MCRATATLYVQGMFPIHLPLYINLCMCITESLSAVTNITYHSTSIILTWSAPFSLNITTAKPDIAYCMQIFNITEMAREHLLTDCSVYQEGYIYTQDDPNPTDEFDIVVIPRSNVEGSKNWTASQPARTRFSCLTEENIATSTTGGE